MCAPVTDAQGIAIWCRAGDTADPHHPDAVRASRGTVFALRLVRASVTELLDWTRRHSVRVVGSSPAELALCDRLVRVPMVGRADSLNLAVAAAVLLYEVYHQHRADASTGPAAEVPRAPLP